MKIKINIKTLVHRIEVAEINNRLTGVVKKPHKIINSPSSSLMMVLKSLSHRRNAAKTIKVKAMFLA